MIVRTISLFRGYITCKSMYFYQKESRGELSLFLSLILPSRKASRCEFYPPDNPPGARTRKTLLGSSTCRRLSLSHFYLCIFVFTCVYICMYILHQTLALIVIVYLNHVLFPCVYVCISIFFLIYKTI